MNTIETKPGELALAQLIYNKTSILLFPSDTPVWYTEKRIDDMLVIWKKQYSK